MSNDKVVYRHSTPCGKIFYIGMGSLERAYNQYSRNIFWKRIKKKYGGFNVEILADNLSLEQAYDLEELLISEYGRRDNGTGILCNLDDGGAGANGHIVNKIINVKTKKIYNTIQEIDAGVCYQYLCQQLKGSRKNLTDYMYLKDYEKGKHLTEKWKNRHKKTIKPIKKRVYRVYDNKEEIVIVGTMDELNAKTKISLLGLNKNNSRGNGRYILLESAYDNKQLHRWNDVLDKETNKIERFNQIHLANHLGVKSNNLSSFFSGKHKVLYGRYIMVFYNPIKNIYE